MPLVTQKLVQFPWIGGINDSVDQATLPPNQGVVFDDVLFGRNGVRAQRPGINYNWDDGWYETTEITCVGASDITDGQYFTLQSAADATAYYVWYNKDSGGSDPAPGGKTAIEVAVTTGDDADTVATATAAAIAAANSGADFSASAASGVVTVTNLAAGTTTDAANVDVGGSFAISVTVQGIGNSGSMIALHDFWRGSTSKSHSIVGVSTDKEIRSYGSDGTKSEDLFSGTAWSSSITKAQMATFNNLCLIAVDGSGNVMKKWDGSASTVSDLGGTPPQASLLVEHQNRIWTNDKTSNDKIHYCTTGNPEEWNGTGDSGSLIIGDGDGDPTGVTSMFVFKGELFVLKADKVYRVSGNTPETYRVEEVARTVGSEAASVANVDVDDVFFVSLRGVHSLAATNSFADFTGTFVSYDIQGTFLDNLATARIQYAQMAYLPEENSIALACSDNRLSNASSNNNLLLYNVPLKLWYRWPNIICESIATVRDGDRRRFYLGNNTNRVAKTFTGTDTDTTTAGATSTVVATMQSGTIYPDNDIYQVKGFKKFGLIYRPRGTHTITVTLKVDDRPIQSIAFTDVDGGDTLGETFVLGQSTLGYNRSLGPYTKSIGGYGRGIQFTITTSSTSELVDIYGYVIEYEPASTATEVSQTQSS